MASIFGDLRVRYDPWEVDYGDQTPLAAPEQESAEKVDLEIEEKSSRWVPIYPPSDAVPPRRALFVDGVRRLEARIHVREGEQLVYGAFGSFAIGWVELHSSAAAFGEARPFRTAVLGADLRFPSDVQVRPDLVYRAESTPEREVDSPFQYIQDSMRREEAKLAGELSREDALVIVDGPLSFEAERHREPVASLGYIKRLHKLYLPPRLLPLLATLPAGTRTPLFDIQYAKSGFHRYAWFQRLAKPSEGASEMHGIVRLEVSSKVGISRALALANTTTAWLPRVAPKQARDPRSPQNLLPIGALEQRLRIHLGNAQLFRRWIQTLIAKEARRV